MTVIGLLVVLVLIGVGLYLINTVLPIDPKIRTIINVIVVVLVLLWVAEVFGLLGPLNHRLR